MVPGEGREPGAVQDAPTGVRQTRVRILALLHIGSVALVWDTEAWGLHIERGFSVKCLGPLALKPSEQDSKSS